MTPQAAPQPGYRIKSHPDPDPAGCSCGATCAGTTWHAAGQARPGQVRQGKVRQGKAGRQGNRLLEIGEKDAWSEAHRVACSI